MTTKRRKYFLGLGVLVALATTGCEITPQNWGPVTSSYNGQVRVRGEGTLYNEDNVNAANRMKITDPMDDGNNVYGRTTFNVYKWSTSAGRMMWQTDERKSTGEWSGGTRTRTVKTSLDANGERYRGESEACAQMGWPVPDSCSSAYLTFDY
ncbi:MAG: hypothetical protein KF906_02720 [Actinobacteria bacterium]|nr:hypothetical protein [Actinomycetota bacterium]